MEFNTYQIQTIVENERDEHVKKTSWLRELRKSKNDDDRGKRARRNR